MSSSPRSSWKSCNSGTTTRFLKRRWKKLGISSRSFFMTARRSPPACRTTAICWPERSKISFRASGPCVAAMWTVALAGTATACRSKWKLSRPWTCTAKVRSSALGWPTSTPSAARSCCAIPRSGKRPCAGPVAGSISATTTGPWTCRSWKRCGGRSGKCGTRTWSTRAIRSCRSRLVWGRFCRTLRPTSITKMSKTRRSPSALRPTGRSTPRLSPGPPRRGPCPAIWPWRSARTLTMSRSETMRMAPTTSWPRLGSRRISPSPTPARLPNATRAGIWSAGAISRCFRILPS